MIFSQWYVMLKLNLSWIYEKVDLTSKNKSLIQALRKLPDCRTCPAKIRPVRQFFSAFRTLCPTHRLGRTLKIYLNFFFRSYKISFGQTIIGSLSDRMSGKFSAVSLSLLYNRNYINSRFLMLFYCTIVT